MNIFELLEEKKDTTELNEFSSKEFYKLFLEELEKLNQLFLSTHSPCIQNDEIKLYVDDSSNTNDDETHFIIYNSDNKNVGIIKFMGNNMKEKYTYGNVYYFINLEYRGNGYALKALKLMSQKLYSDGIKELLIATKKENTPSLNIIKNFGGKQIPSTNKKISLFKCDLKELTTQKNTSKR